MPGADVTRETRDHHRLEIHRLRPSVGFRRVMSESLRPCSWRLSCRWERRSVPGPSVWVLPPLVHPLVWCSALGPFLVLVLPPPAISVRGQCASVSRDAGPPGPGHWIRMCVLSLSGARAHLGPV